MKLTLNTSEDKSSLFFIWLFFTPFLLFSKCIRPWWLRIILILISPMTIILSFLCAVLMIFATAPENQRWASYHEFHNEDDISQMTYAPIPPCDTICAIYNDLGLDYDKKELFIMKHEMTSREKRLLRSTCATVEFWSETDSTFEFYRSDSILNTRSNHRYDYLTVSVPKKGQKMELHYGRY